MLSASQGQARITSADVDLALRDPALELGTGEAHLVGALAGPACAAAQGRSSLSRSCIPPCRPVHLERTNLRRNVYLLRRVIDAREGPLTTRDGTKLSWLAPLLALAHSSPTRRADALRKLRDARRSVNARSRPNVR